MGILSKIKGITARGGKFKTPAETENVIEQKKENDSEMTANIVAPTNKTLGCIVRPVVTEKTAILASKNTYVFMVKKDANRTEVGKAIKEMYDITPVSVNMQCVRGKVVRHGKVTGRRKGWKKAIVTLPKGKSIQVYEGV